MGKFGAIKAVRKEAMRTPQTIEPERVISESLSQPALVNMRGRPAGKRSNPEFEPTTIFLRKTTKKTANRALEDRDIPKDLSELIEELLQTWNSEHA